MAKTSSLFITEISGGVATITLDRPEKHNLLDAEVIKRLTLEIKGLSRNPTVRVLILTAEGKSFSAGADLNWCYAAATSGYEENLDDAKGLATLMKTLYDLRKPTIAAVQGSAFGGGVGMMAACDIVVAAEGAEFALTEVKLGIIPAAISPYLIVAMGPRQAQRYMLTAERFSAAKALDLGLVQEVVPAEDVKSRARAMAEAMLKNGPQALNEVKHLMRYVTFRSVDETLVSQVAGHLARVRSSPEGLEGFKAFLEKRRPNWDKS